MRRWFLHVLCLACLILIVTIYAAAPPAWAAEPLKFSASTQFLWGDDLLGEDQAIIAQYLKFAYVPDGERFTLTGYGRLWKDFGSPAVRNDDFDTRLYYFYLDYTPIENASIRAGRQYVNFSAGSAILDGATVNVGKLGPVGITVAGGREVVYTLDSEYSRSGNYLVGVDLHLDGIRSVQFGVSYVRKYDASDLAREEFGTNFRYIYKVVSPYAQVRYDRLSDTVDEQTYGVDVFPIRNLVLKGEFYQSYPTFDATSIYSVFAVDKYREYLARAEYSFEWPVSLFVSYMKQVYQEADDANVYSVGARVYPLDNLNIYGAVNYRMGYSGYDGFTGASKGKLVGYELNGSYRFMKAFAVVAGIQYDTYKRPEINGNNYATRYWAGGQWTASKRLAMTARIENNVNENFDHRTLGRFTLDWNL